MTKMKFDHQRTGLDEIDVALHPARDAAHFRRILAASENLAAAEKELRDAVDAAVTPATRGRSSGPRWTPPAKRHRRGVSGGWTSTTPERRRTQASSRRCDAAVGARTPKPPRTSAGLRGVA